MESTKIILLWILAAIAYGIIHDQVTARVCVEYFTIGHPPVFGTNSPTILALGWGVIATWWAGLLMGIPAALVSRIGTWPKYDAVRLVGPVCRLFFAMGCISIVAGFVGYFVADAGAIVLTQPMRSLVPAQKHSAFLADLWAHTAAYATGLLGSIAVCVWILFHRRRVPTGNDCR